ncbi:peptidase M14 carboxypeptidase A [Psychroflexus gondwanensis ACAM 44]|uniref:Peptidase M14 carboxypeptidase A n=1 Tax=Psychroflexus gondwanensis ACAM 44 TaxID=1189619 RepID=N1WP34_9FLAO|nr:LamG-like jellyroll fold domain-containing protein [Psychroflexus gondwanensis]EMY80750.1 peptidase M14 carboxypeptidase A [Psychroflexus gondwanensis ACAM 44]
MNKITYVLFLTLTFFYSQTYAQGSGNALSLNGSNTDITIAHNSNLVDENTLSYELWFNPSSFGGYKQMIGKSVHGGGTSRAQMGIWLGGSQLNARVVRTGGGRLNLTGSGVQLNRWNHVAAVYGDGFFKLYLNGQEIASSVSTASLVTNTDPLKIGCDFGRCGGDGLNYTFDGVIDEVRVWKKALSETEVRENMCKKLVGNEVDLGGYWRLDEGSGSIVVDATSNSADGTFSTSPPSWLVSGAPIGDSSDFFYNTPISSSDSFIHSSTAGDTFTVSNVTDSPDGIHIYSVDSSPNTDNGIIPLGINAHYYGVFVANSTSAEYTVEYDYSDNPSFLNLVSVIDESDLVLNKREKNDEIAWLNTNGSQNISNKTISTLDISRQEYYLGYSKYIFNVNGDWETVGNWSNNDLPPVNADVLIAANADILSNQNITNIDVNSGVTINVTTGINLNIQGDLENNGSITGDGEVVLNGTSAQAISGGGSFENLRLNNTTTVDFNDASDLFGVLYVDQGTLNTNGNLSLRCNFGTPPKTAQIGPVGGAIVGDVTVEQCYPARRAFRFLSSSVTTSTSIKENWQEGASSYTDNPNPGYGTHITGVSPGSANAIEGQDGNNGFDYSPSGNASMFTFDNATPSWDRVTNTNGVLTAGEAYRLFLRGDRSIDITLNESPPTATRLSATGVLAIGAQTETNLSNTANAFNFIGNPYQAQVNVNSLVTGSTNISSAEYYVWDPTLGGSPTPGLSGGRGAYVTVNLPSGTNSFSPSGTNKGSNANQFLQPMQAAFVRTNTDAPASVTFQEAMKAVNEIQTDVKSNSVQEYINIQLFNAEAFSQGSTPSDGLRINFDKSFSILTEDDSPKLGNLDENLARVEGNAFSAIERRPLPEATEELLLFINQYRRESYVMKFDVTDNLNIEVFIKDSYLETLTEITSSENTYSFAIESSIPESVASDRFSLVFEPVSLSTGNEDLVNLSLYPNPTKGNFSISGIDSGQDTEVKIYNLIGQQVYTAKSSGQSTLEITDFNGTTGVYLVKLNTNQGEKTFKLIKD